MAFWTFLPFKQTWIAFSWTLFILFYYCYIFIRLPFFILIFIIIVTIIFVIIIFVIVIAIIISSFSMLLTFIFLVFIILFYLCTYRIFLNFKQMTWLTLRHKRDWDCMSVFDGNFQQCLLNLFFWRFSFEVTLLHFSHNNYFFYSVFFNLDLSCCWVICIFVCNLTTHWQSFWKEDKYLWF